MSKFQKLVLVLLTAIVLLPIVWIGIMSGMALLADGYFYSIEDPVPTRLDKGNVIYIVKRNARWGLIGTCSKKLVCAQVIHFKPFFCSIEPGYAEFEVMFELPEEAEGECKLVGSVSYSPFGKYGPPLVEFWESELFEIE